jgi:hypothetical protein
MALLDPSGLGKIDSFLEEHHFATPRRFKPNTHFATGTSELLDRVGHFRDNRR